MESDRSVDTLSRQSTHDAARTPHTYFEELAQMGSLYDFLTTYMADEFQSNQQFRKEMMHLMLDNAEGVEAEIEYELLTDLHEAMNHFLEKMRACNHTLH